MSSATRTECPELEECGEGVSVRDAAARADRWPVLSEPHEDAYGALVCQRSDTAVGPAVAGVHHQLVSNFALEYLVDGERHFDGVAASAAVDLLAGDLAADEDHRMALHSLLERRDHARAAVCRRWDRDQCNDSGGQNGS